MNSAQCQPFQLVSALPGSQCVSAFCAHYRIGSPAGDLQQLVLGPTLRLLGLLQVLLQLLSLFGPEGGTHKHTEAAAEQFICPPLQRKPNYLNPIRELSPA